MCHFGKQITLLYFSCIFSLLSGDGRMDSPGHCAQFCTYTMIEHETRDIVHIVREDKRRFGRNSVILEKVCFESTIDCLLNEIPIKEVVTDAHRQISALLDPVRGKYKDWSLTHSLDVWHASKNIGRKLREAPKGKEHTVLMHWVKDIVNHFWYCCQRASTVEQFKMLWHGVLHHVRNEHTWATGFCEHEPLDDSSQDKPWIQQGSAAHQTLNAIVLNKRWLKDVKKYITFRTTSDLESFRTIF
uniref:Uncharacterized protein n=1 Tax=Neogobius melanostomus TaxID=47308 RepID=A0A8C6UD43_9GOBI